MPAHAAHFEVARAYRFLKGSGLPVRIPVIEMVEIGAGGGSIARVDALGRIQVGPDSAGAVPGPGLLRPRRHAADRHRCRCGAGPARPRRASPAADRRSTPTRAAGGGGGACGAADVAGRSAAPSASPRSSTRTWPMPRACMPSRAARTPPGARMIAFGGAAPLHAARLAREARHRRASSCRSAPASARRIGFLRAPIAYEVVRSRYMRLERFDADAGQRAVRRDARGGRARWCARGAPAAVLGETPHRLHALSRPGPRDRRGAARRATLADGDAAMLHAAFEAAYTRAVRPRHPAPGGRGADLVALALSASRALPARVGEPPPLPSPAAAGLPRRSLDPGTGAAEPAAVHERAALLPGARWRGRR